MVVVEVEVVVEVVVGNRGGGGALGDSATVGGYEVRVDLLLGYISGMYFWERARLLPIGRAGELHDGAQRRDRVLRGGRGGGDAPVGCGCVS